MASYNNRSGAAQRGSDGSNPGFFSRALRSITNWGMEYDDFAIKNSVAVGLNQLPTPVGAQNNLYDVFAQNAAQLFFKDKSIAYLDATLQEKLVVLNQYARKDEIREFIDIIVDEAVMYDDDVNFCFPKTVPNELEQNIKESYTANFEKIYARMGFKDGIIASNYFRKLIVMGYIAFEIVYDDKQRSIEAFLELDPASLLPGIEPNTGDRIWIQYPEIPEYRRILLDSQIIYISYSSGTDYTGTSYVENLIRPYNQYTLLTQTRIMFNILNSMIYKKFIVPTNGMSRQVAEEQIAKLISTYKDEVTFNDEMGIVSINGSPKLSYSKEIWLPNGDGGSPTVELMNPQGHNLNENDMLTWFYNALKRASKIPFSRFDKTNGGGNIFGDTGEVTRDELNFFNFITRLRTIFKEILVKPWKLQMLLDYPELKGDEHFMASVNVEFNGVNMFHEWKKLNNLAKRTEILGTLSSSITGADGQPYLHVDWLVREILKLSEEDIRANERWKAIKPNGEAAGGGGGGGGAPGGGGMDPGGMDLGAPAPDGGGDAGAPPASDAGADAGADAAPAGDSDF